jgi:hypothetical protein
MLARDIFPLTLQELMFYYCTQNHIVVRAFLKKGAGESGHPLTTSICQYRWCDGPALSEAEGANTVASVSNTMCRCPLR